MVQIPKVTEQSIRVTHVNVRNAQVPRYSSVFKLILTNVSAQNKMSGCKRYQTSDVTKRLSHTCDTQIIKATIAWTAPPYRAKASPKISSQPVGPAWASDIAMLLLCPLQVDCLKETEWSLGARRPPYLFNVMFLLRGAMSCNLHVWHHLYVHCTFHDNRCCVIPH
jgi:hypothetical protein